MRKVFCAKCEIPIKSCENHFHGGWEITLQLEGNATANIGGCEYPLTPGTITVIPPKMVHRNYSDNLYSDIFLEATDLDFNDIVVTQDIDNEVLPLMNMLHKTVTEKKEQYDIIASRITDLICLYIQRLCNTDTRFPFVNSFKNTVYRNLSNPEFKIDNEIKNLGYHPDYFRRCFKKVTGMTPINYLTTLRINQAKILLEQSGFISISAVAANCGFNDSFYFSTCFKKQVGISPRDYRKNFINA